MASGRIRKRGTNRWELTWDIPRGVDGKRQRRYETVRGTKKQADTRLRQIMAALDHGRRPFEPSMSPVREFLGHWLEVYAKSNVRRSTYHRYAAIIRLHLEPTIGHIPLSHLTVMDVQNLLNERRRAGKSPNTVRSIRQLLGQALRQAVRWEMVDRNVVDAVRPPRVPKHQVRTLSATEAQAILREAHGTDYYAPIYLAIHAGLRRGEVMGLRWSDVDLFRKTITVEETVIAVAGVEEVGEPKSESSRRRITISDDVVDMLIEHRQRLEGSLAYFHLSLGPFTRVCVRSDGRVIRPDDLTNAHKRFTRRLGIAGVRLHDQRHTHATVLLEAGIPMPVVSERLGHETIQTTVDIYGHISDAADAEAARVFASLRPSRR